MLNWWPAKLERFYKPELPVEYPGGSSWLRCGARNAGLVRNWQFATVQMKYQMDAKRNGDDDCVIGSPDGCETRQSDQLFQRKLDGAQKGQLLNTIFQQFQPISTNFKSHLNQIWTGIEGRQL